MLEVPIFLCINSIPFTYPIKMWRMLTFSTFLFLVATSPSTGAPPVKSAYWPSDLAKILPSSEIDTSLFTHIYYAFLSPNHFTYKFQLSQHEIPLLSAFISGLRRKKPRVKTIISIGGAADGSTLYANMASTAIHRKAFIDSSIEVARRFGFDGLDLDWESPENPKQMKDLGLLLKEWRAEVSKEARATRRSPLLLTAAVYFASDFFLAPVYRAFPARTMARNLDWINVMCYDYHGAWDTSATGAHAAFFDPNSNVSSSYGLQSWIKAGMPRKKIIMGLPLYGKTWELKTPKVNEIGAPAIGLGPGDVGILLYYQVEEFIKKNNATVVYDETTISAYSYSGTSWVGYDDVRSTTVKIGLARALKVRGYFFWALSYDHDWEISTHASRAWNI